MNANSLDIQLFDPPAALTGFHTNDWSAIPPVDPVVDHMVDPLWDQSGPPLYWQPAPLSKMQVLLLNSLPTLASFRKGYR